MDWHIFETAGKYAGLAGIAIIVLLYLFRQILKLDIFKNVGSQGTLLLINNIINKVFWVTILALLCWLAVALYGKSTQGGTSSENVSTIYGQNIKPADLPPELTNPVSEDSPDQVSQQLKQRNSLTLNGTTLTIGAPGEGRTVTIACNTLRMSNGAKIITNGNRLLLISLHAQFGENAGIASFGSDSIVPRSLRDCLRPDQRLMSCSVRLRTKWSAEVGRLFAASGSFRIQFASNRVLLSFKEVPQASFSKLTSASFEQGRRNRAVRAGLF